MVPTKQDLITRMYEESVSWSCSCCEDPSTITQTVLETAKEFIEQLPEKLLLPQKIFPDAEGSLLMVWGDKTCKTIIVVDEWKLHIIIKGSELETEYFDDILFKKGSSIPTVALKAIEIFCYKTPHEIWNGYNEVANSNYIRQRITEIRAEQ